MHIIKIDELWHLKVNVEDSGIYKFEKKSTYIALQKIQILFEKATENN